MLTHIRDFHHKLWDHSRTRTVIAILIGASLLLLCGCAKQELSPTPTDAPLFTEAVPTPTTAPTPTFTPLPSPAPAPRSSADVALQASQPIQVVPGETTIYTLTVRNDGPAAATTILLTDTLPLDVVPVWAQAAEPVCARQQRSLRCEVGDLWAGDAATVTLDLSVGGTETPITGTQLAGVAWDVSAPTCELNRDGTPPHVTCRLSKLQPGAEARVRIGVGVEASITGTLIHTATVTASEVDADHTDNRTTFTMTVAPAVVTIVPSATDLVLEAEGPSTVTAGQPFTYTYTITNRGTLDATGVWLEDIVPSDLNLVAYAPGPPLCEQQGDVFTCSLRDPDSDQSATFTLVITGYDEQPVAMSLDPLSPGWPICSVIKERTWLHVVQCELGTLGPGQATRVELVFVAIGVRERTTANTASLHVDEVDANPADNTSTATITIQVGAEPGGP